MLWKNFFDKVKNGGKTQNKFSIHQRILKSDHFLEMRKMRKKMSITIF
jgi:hypothetical protein